MKVKDIIKVIYDKVSIYRDNGDGDFIDLYNGTAENIPSEILGMDVRIIGAKRKEIVDIEVGLKKGQPDG